MVYDTKGKGALHQLTELGERNYHDMLERFADEILYSTKHPFKYWFNRVGNLARTGDSAWDGPPPCSQEDAYQDGFAYSTQDLELGQDLEME